MSIQIIPTEPGSLCRETIIQSNDAVGEIKLGVITGNAKPHYYFVLAGEIIWIESIVLEETEVRCGAHAHGKVGDHHVCTIYIQKNHLDDAKTLLQEVKP